MKFASNLAQLFAALGLGPFATQTLLVSQYKAAINSKITNPNSNVATSCDAMFLAVVQPNEGDPTMIAWRSVYAPAGGFFENLVTSWLTATTANGGLGQSSATAASTIASLRQAAASLAI